MTNIVRTFERVNISEEYTIEVISFVIVHQRKGDSELQHVLVASCCTVSLALRACLHPSDTGHKTRLMSGVKVWLQHMYVICIDSGRYWSLGIAAACAASSQVVGACATSSRGRCNRVGSCS